MSTLSLIAICIIYYSLSEASQFSNCSQSGPCFESCLFDTSTKCDTLPSIPINELMDDDIYIYRTSRNTNEKFGTYKLKWSTSSSIINDNNTLHFNILYNNQHHTINGFGGAFTDAVSYNLGNLNSSKLENEILSSYFIWVNNDNHSNGTGGSGYRFGRVPIGSCDFSLYSYSYSDTKNDFNLNNFSLNQIWDLSEKYGRINVIKKCQKMVQQSSYYLDDPTNDRLHLYAVPWSAPFWMKDNQKYTNGGKLYQNKTYFEAYSLYFIKYLQSYLSLGNISFDAISVQNEPNLPAPWESTQWTTLEMTKFIAMYLGPKLTEFNHENNKNVGIWIHDGQKGDLPELVYNYFDEYYMNNYNVSSYYIGLGAHWYFYPPPIPGCPKFECDGAFKQVKLMREYLDDIQNRSDIYMMGTEACEGGTNSIKSPPNRGVSLGDWYRGEQYGEDIIGDINNGVSGWLDWNLVLDINGGPNHANNTCDAPIVIDFDKEIYYKQPMYYYLAHISRFIRPKSIHIDMEVGDDYDEEHIWFTSVIDYRMNMTVIVIMNTHETQQFDIEIHDDRKGYFEWSLQPHSIQTFLYNN